MDEVTTIGIDLAEGVFQLHGVGEDGGVLLRQKLRRGQVLAFFKALPHASWASKPAPERITGRAS